MKTLSENFNSLIRKAVIFAFVVSQTSCDLVEATADTFYMLKDPKGYQTRDTYLKQSMGGHGGSDTTDVVDKDTIPPHSNGGKNKKKTGDKGNGAGDTEINHPFEEYDDLYKKEQDGTITPEGQKKLDSLRQNTLYISPEEYDNLCKKEQDGTITPEGQKKLDSLRQNTLYSKTTGFPDNKVN